MANDDSLAFVLGGGEGKRLLPLTSERAKPAVPMAGTFRIIDFVMSNLYNSDIRKVYVLTQYNSKSLHDHIRFGWYPKFGTGPKGFLKTQPATQSRNGGWYSGTADAIAQNMGFIEDERPGIVNVFGGDHIYLMDIRQMNEYHLKNDADITISAIPVSRKLAAGNYGVLEISPDGRLLGFEEKPANPKPMPGNPDMCLSSMGNYAFKPGSLLEELLEDKMKVTAGKIEVAEQPLRLSSHDFGYDIIPSMMRKGRNVFVYNFMDNKVEGARDSERGYWRDVGNRDEFFNANMELKAIIPPINLYNPYWEVLTHVPVSQAAKVNGEGVKDSIMSPGCIVTNSLVDDSILSYSTIVEKSSIRGSILLGSSKVGEGCEIVRSVVDRHVDIPAGTKIGVDKEKDLARGFFVTESGLTFVPNSHTKF